MHNLVPNTYSRYVEPFCGSACLLVALRPDKALIGDINEELVHFYKMISWRPIAVAKLTHSLPSDSETYYQLRALVPTQLSAEQRAARFLYLNRYCFNGVYRTNRSGQFNVARGEHMGNIPPIEELVNFGRMMRKVTIRKADFADIVADAGHGDFVYLDPPYAGRDVRDRGEYGLGAFKIDEMQRLVASVKGASDRGAKILLSYADLPELPILFDGWNFDRIQVSRNVSGFNTGRKLVSELVLRNYS